MSTRIAVLAGALIALAGAGTTALAQYVPSQPGMPQAMAGPAAYGSGYNNPYVAMRAPPQAVMPGYAMPQAGPAMRAPGPAMWYPINPGPAASGPNSPPQSAYRVRVIENTPRSATYSPNLVTPATFSGGPVPVADCDDCLDDSLAGDCDNCGGKSDGCGKCGGKSHCCNCCGCGFTFRFFGEFLYLRSRDSEIPYAVEENSDAPQNPPTYPIQTSPIALVDHDYSAGFRAGFGVSLDECTEICATYTLFVADTENAIERGQANIRQIFPMTIHPATQNTVSGTTAAAARYDLEFELIDLDYRKFLWRSDRTDVTYLVGFRYGQLQQDFAARYTDNLDFPYDDANVMTNIDFDGAGLRLGMETEHYTRRHRMLFYGRGVASIMAGEFSARYQQVDDNDVIPEVDTAWTAGRILPTFDLEVGGGFHCCEGRFRFTIGYMYSVWTNVVKTEDWIQGVQHNNYNDMGDSMTFDGFVARVEARL